MTAHEVAPNDGHDDEEPYVGGDCAPFVQLCWHAFTDVAAEAHLAADERWAWLVLLMTADYRTGVLDGITRVDVGLLLDCSRPIARQRVDRLERAGLVASRFPRGHVGWIAVTSYLEVVRVRPSHAEAIHRALSARQLSSRAGRGCCGPRSATSLPSDGRELAERENTPLGYRLAERPGERAVPRGAEEVAAPSTSTTEVGGRSRRSTSVGSREGTRVTRETVCPLLGSPVVVPFPRRRPWTEDYAVERLLGAFPGAVLVAS